MGDIFMGVGNNESGAASTVNTSTFMWNTLVTAGIPVPLTLPTQTSFYMGLYAQWVANPTVMLCTQFMVFGLN
jgi:hypothetical protein